VKFRAAEEKKGAKRSTVPPSGVILHLPVLDCREIFEFEGQPALKCPGPGSRLSFIAQRNGFLSGEWLRSTRSTIFLASASASEIAATYAGEFLGTVASFLAARIEAHTAMIAD
jgi:hypothetical protein